MAGALVLSLDFELYWGVHGFRSLSSYRENLEGVWRAVPAMLDVFRRADVHATWATVGFIMLDDANEARAHEPRLAPEYADSRRCPYRYLRTQYDGATQRLHFAPQLVEAIVRTRNQELATHTLCHFDCLEPATSTAAFKADLEVALAVAKRRFGLPLTSMVFPRNLFTREHLTVARELGITAYRGNVEAGTVPDRGLATRASRLLDEYVPLSRPSRPVTVTTAPNEPDNVPGSRRLRPWSARLRHLERFRVKRICAEMARAAREGGLYHLWWHPHNFGRNLGENIRVLSEILSGYERLRDRYGMQSLTMREASAVPRVRPSPN